jgi:hypothetical protein
MSAERLLCAVEQIRAPRMPAPVYGKFGAASRSLMVRRLRCRCALLVHALNRVALQAAHELQQAGFTRVSHAVRCCMRVECMPVFSC